MFSDVFAKGQLQCLDPGSLYPGSLDPRSSCFPRAPSLTSSFELRIAFRSGCCNIMEILDTAQRFVLVNGELRFSHIYILFRSDNTIYYKQSPIRKSKHNFSGLDNIQNIQPILIEIFIPLLPFGYTVISDTINSYIKKPDLILFGTGIKLDKFIFYKIEVKKAFKKYLYLNLTEYYKYITSESRISGFCFRRYL